MKEQAEVQADASTECELEQKEQAVRVHGGTHESPKHNIEQKKTQYWARHREHGLHDCVYKRHIQVRMIVVFGKLWQDSEQWS